MGYHFKKENTVPIDRFLEHFAYSGYPSREVDIDETHLEDQSPIRRRRHISVRDRDEEEDRLIDKIDSERE